MGRSGDSWDDPRRALAGITCQKWRTGPGLEPPSRVFRRRSGLLSAVRRANRAADEPAVCLALTVQPKMADRTNDAISKSFVLSAIFGSDFMRSLVEERCNSLGVPRTSDVAPVKSAVAM